MKKRPTSRFKGAGWMIAAFVGVAAMFVLLEEETQAPPVQSSPPAVDTSVPPFHRDAESARPFPAIVDPARFEVPVVSRAYAIAQEIPEVLSQQPCYCNCGVFGHGSLLDCFATDHGAT